MKTKVAVTIILVFLMYSISACAWPFGKKSNDAKDVSVAEKQNENTDTGTNAQQPQSAAVGDEQTGTQKPQKVTSPKGQTQSQPKEPTAEETKTKDDEIIQESQTENVEYTIKKNNTEEVQFFEIIEVKQLYNLKGKTLAALPGLIGMGNDSTIDIKIGKDKDVPWRVTIKILNGKNLVMQSRTKLDKSASVLEEISYISETKGKNEKQTLTVSIEEQPFLGKGKVVRLNKDKSDVSELMVGLDDPITTFMQVLVWVSTIKTIPDKGLSFRWVMNGNPLPVILRELETDDKTGICYAIFSNNSDSFSEKHPGEKPKPIVRFFFPKNRQGFTMPNEFELMISSFSVVFQKGSVKE